MNDETKTPEELAAEAEQARLAAAAEAARAAEAAVPAPKVKHPANIGLDHARDMEVRGYSRDAVVDWLFTAYPQHFAGPKDARAVYDAEFPG